MLFGDFKKHISSSNIMLQSQNIIMFISEFIYVLTFSDTSAYIKASFQMYFSVVKYHDYMAIHFHHIQFLSKAL